MKRFILKYQLELFTALALIVTVVDAVLFSRLSDTRKLVNLFLLLGVIHEWEEKRFPGGFFELMGKKFGIQLNELGLEKAGMCVIVYWLVILCLPYIFDRAVFLLIIPVALGLFEAFIHTAGIFLHKMKRPYTPGLVTAWLMAAASIYTIHYLTVNGLAGAGDYVLGVALMAAGFLLMDVGVLRSFGMSVKDIPAKVKQMRGK